MRTLVVFVAVAALSVLASNQRLLHAGRFLNLAQLAASGLVFLVFGALLGPGGVDLLIREDLVSARPLLALGLGLAGMLLGMSLEPQLLRTLPGRVWAAAAVQSGFAGLAVLLPLSALFLLTVRMSPVTAIGAAAILGGAASVSSAHLAVLWHRAGRLERARGLSVALLAMLDDVTGVAVLALALLLAGSTSVWIGGGLVGLAIVIGALCGALTAFLIHETKDHAELTAMLLGAVALVAGIAAFLNVSSLIAGIACGATLAVVGGKQVTLAWRDLARVERPVYLLLLFLIGAHVQPLHWQAWLVVPAFVALRFLGKIFGGRIAARTAAPALQLPPEVGFALLSQGGVALCLLIEFVVLVGGPAAQLVFDIGVAGVLVNEVLASRVFKRALWPSDVVEVAA